MAGYLADTSALIRMRRSSVDQRLTPLMLAGEVSLCGVVELEMLYGARDHAEALRAREWLRRSLAVVEMAQADFDRAEEVLLELGRRGKHRAAGFADLLVSAAAERIGRTVIHYDADFETISAVTGQPQEWVVPRGSVP